MYNKKELTHLLVGYGEVGKGLHKVLGKAEVFDIKGKNTYSGNKVDFIHICIPYSRDFKKIVSNWKTKGIVIVHSSVPVGTCDELGVVHSPIVGKHPNLEKGIRTFTKYFGGKQAKKAAKIFSTLRIKTKVYKKARTTEAMKLISTTYYGLNIMIEKEIYAWCNENNLDFKVVYSENNKDYNRGYLKLGNPEFMRPNLKQIEGKISGHCIIPNLKLIKDFWLAKLLLNKNKKY